MEVVQKTMEKLRELYDYREMIKNLVLRDLKSRYKESVLGFLWMLVNPLLQLVVYTIVFSVIMRANIDKFYLFLFVALVPWIFFNSCLTGGSYVIFEAQDMIKKIYFPREIVPLAFSLSQFVNMVLSFVVIFVVVIISGVKVKLLGLLMLPLVMLIELLLGVGVSLIVSSLSVYYRDLQQILGVVALAWMYMTPILYPVEYVPEELGFVILLNPMAPIIVSYREILYYGKVPDATTLISALAVGIISLIVGSCVFDKLQKGFAEEL